MKGTTLGLLAVAAVLGLGLMAAAAVRLLPPGASWHADPATVTPPAARNFWLLRDDGGSAPALRLPLPPEDAARRLAAIAAATPRTSLLSDDDGFTTWITRSRLMGYPDTTSVRIRPDGTGSEVLIFARSRIGSYDWGVNRARVEAWAAALSAP